MILVLSVVSFLCVLIFSPIAAMTFASNNYSPFKLSKDVILHSPMAIEKRSQSERGLGGIE